MKKVILLTAFVLTGMVSANNSVTSKALSTDPSLLADTHCYKKMKDVFGNVYYAEVPCPKVIIIN